MLECYKPFMIMAFAGAMVPVRPTVTVLPRETPSADLGRVDEGLVAEVVVLAGEGLERAEPVGVA